MKHSATGSACNNCNRATFNSATSVGAAVVIMPPMWTCTRSYELRSCAHSASEVATVHPSPLCVIPRNTTSRLLAFTELERTHWTGDCQVRGARRTASRFHSAHTTRQFFQLEHWLCTLLKHPTVTLNMCLPGTMSS